MHGQRNIKLQYIQFKHSNLIITQNQLHVVANILPLSGWLVKQEGNV